jgi:tRNA (guanine-N7-)-methyltransferase
MADRPPFRTFGRTRSRRLKPRRAALFDDLLPELAIPTEPFDPRLLGLATEEIWLEIGFGAGEHLAAAARARPDVMLLGAETFIDGVGSLLRYVEGLALQNVRIHAGDARDLMANLPPGSIDRLFVLFPDPWPKARHRKRRLVQTSFVLEAARILKPRARARIATDWADYAESILVELLSSPDFAWTAAAADDWRIAPADHFPTRYQTRQLGDCPPIWLDFKRI